MGSQICKYPFRFQKPASSRNIIVSWLAAVSSSSSKKGFFSFLLHHFCIDFCHFQIQELLQRFTYFTWKFGWTVAGPNMAPVNKKKKAVNEAAASSTPCPSDTKSPNSLNPENKIVKPLNQNPTKKKVVKRIIRRVVKVIPRVQEKPKDENKSMDETSKEKSTDNQNKEKVQEQKKEKTIANVEGNNEKNKRVRTEKEKEKVQEQKKEKTIANVEGNNEKNKRVHTEKEKTNHQIDDVKKQKLDERNKGKTEKDKTNHQRNEGKKQKLDEINKGKTVTNEARNEKKQRDYKDTEKLGGLILMCNGKTKPDCFRYGVMGVSQSRKETVMGIKPGLKLFLYDFDLKLLYGIYRASSAGGLKLEPSAFGGGFPFQVRFEVDKDCYPLEESVFKNAMKESYNKDKQRFKTELTVQEANNLTELFRPVQPPQSNGHPFVQAAPPAMIVHPVPKTVFAAGEGLEGRRELIPRTHREQFVRDAYTLDEGSRYHMPSDKEREQLSRGAAPTRREMTSTQKDTVAQDPLFLSEQEYRTYGLSRAQHTTKPPVTVPSSDSYRKDHHTEQLHRYHTPMHWESPPSQKEELSSDPLFLSEEAYRKYGLGRELPASTPPAPTASTLDPYLNDPYYYGASSDPYSRMRRTEATSSELYSPLTKRESRISNYDYLERGSTDYSRRRGTDEAERERLYSTYASNALSEYNQRQHLGDRADVSSGSVSSRYSFAGPSLYR